MADRRMSDEGPRAAVHDERVVLIVGALVEVTVWRSTVVELGGSRFAHPAVNEMRFAAAMRVLTRLEQLESALDAMARRLGHRHASAEDGGGEKRCAGGRSVPDSLRHVPDRDWTDPGELEQLPYGQLYDMVFADDPRDLDAAARQWAAISEAAAQRQSAFGPWTYPAPHAGEGDRAGVGSLAASFGELAAVARHNAEVTAKSAESLRRAQQQMTDLGPP